MINFLDLGKKSEEKIARLICIGRIFLLRKSMKPNANLFPRYHGSPSATVESERAGMGRSFLANVETINNLEILDRLKICFKKSEQMEMRQLHMDGAAFNYEMLWICIIFALPSIFKELFINENLNAFLMEEFVSIDSCQAVLPTDTNNFEGDLLRLEHKRNILLTTIL